MNVFDASALLAYLQREQGSDVVSEHLARGGACSAASWSETAQEVLAAGGSWPRARALLNSHPLTVEPVTEADAERAADLWTPAGGLSLGDRCCLALVHRLGASTILTADRAWSGLPGVVLVR